MGISNLKGKYDINEECMQSFKQWLGDDGIRFFRHLKGLTSTVYPTLRLNYKKKGVPIYPVYLREGIKIRNWMRDNIPNCLDIDQNDIDELSIEMIENAIKYV